MHPPDTQAGFTLLEALVALAIISLVVTTCLMFRTGSLVDATEARNWRVAREVAQEILSELQAGAREEPPETNQDPQKIPSMRDVEDWSYQIVVGEERISRRESDLDGSIDSASADSDASDRRAYQQERDDLRAARQAGVSYYEYREQSEIEERDRAESEDTPPSEDEFEEVAVFVFFPNPRAITGYGGKTAHFTLKARISTLALEGLTPEEAETLHGNKTEDPAGAAGAGEGPAK